MSMPRPPKNAVSQAGDALRALSRARQSFALYPPDHPDRHDAVEVVLAELRQIAGSYRDPALFVTRSGFYLGPTLLSRESLALFGLVRAFEGADVESVEWSARVAAEDVVALVEILRDERPLATRLGEIFLNRIDVADLDLPAGELDMGDSRRAYAMGLELVRDMGVRIAAGESLDLLAAAETVEVLTDEVMADPVHALLLTTVKSYDEYTYYHMTNVALLSIALGQALGLRRDQVMTLGLGGLLHDVGKVHVPTDVLTHVGNLSQEQWRVVQRHPVDGAAAMFATGDGLFHPAATVVLEHHSAYDLSGYPSLNRRPRPSLPARLVAVADCFDAVTSNRPYRAPAPRREALSILDSGSGSGFDPRVVRVFAGLLGLFPVGSLVLLDDGTTALVLSNHDKKLARPTVLTVLDPSGSPVDAEERDLTEEGADGEYRWNVARALDPDELGIDVMKFLTTGELESDGGGGDAGLVHEPSFGEATPEGYVDTHNEPGGGHHHPHDHADGRPDDDIHPPI